MGRSLLPNHPLAQHGYDNVWALKSVRPAEELARLGIDRKVGRWRAVLAGQAQRVKNEVHAHLVCVHHARQGTMEERSNASDRLVCVCTQWRGPYCPLTPNQVHRIKLFRTVQEAKPALPDPKLPVSLYSAAA